MEETYFECSYQGCGKRYSNAFNLKRHVESFHRGIKKFRCGICNKGLSSKQNLREHNFIHMGVKPYVCTHSGCKEAFRQASQLIMHNVMHLEVKKQLSSQFSKKFINNSFFSKLLTEETNAKTSVAMIENKNANDIVLPKIKIQNNITDSDKYC